MKITLTLTQGQRSDDQENTLFWPNFDWLGNFHAMAHAQLSSLNILTHF